MKNKFSIALIVSLSGLFFSAFGQENIPNPVLANVADAGVLKFNGKYYIGGVGTNGDFYYSTDLVKWEGPVHVMDMDNDWTRGTRARNNQIHANDMIYLNGKFHLYWSVNYWGNDRHAVHITHAESDSVLGPYYEPVKDTWLENRIDAKVFRDDDGRLYMYMVKFTDGNTIWVRPMSDPRTFSGPPVYQFASLPNTWESMDNKVAEGPWVLKYRGRYYMMYNANHTGTDWGNYQLGVAEADSPMAFNHGGKYPYPLLGSNQTPIEEKYIDLLLFKDGYEPDFYYTEKEPAADWKKLTYSESADWGKGRPGFSSAEIKGSTVNHYGTNWTSENLFLRKTFVLNKKEAGNLVLRVKHNGPTKVYFNDNLVYQSDKGDYKPLAIKDSDKQKLNDGANIIAVETKGGGRRNYFDMSLFDTGKEKTDDILYSPGQPNILRGPNGFEWWLIYMANKNQERRSQYINRVHFFDKTMYADGVTASNTDGYFPNPTKPTFSRQEEFSLEKGADMIMQESMKGTSYLLETGINTQTNAGIIVYQKDADNWIKAGLDSERHSWYYKISDKGTIKEESFRLPEDFRFDVYHTLRIERDANKLEVRIDDLPAPGNHIFTIPFADPSVSGLYSDDGRTLFAGLIYTRGWDEYDNTIQGWGNASEGQKAIGKGVVSEKGITVQTPSFAAYKGDLLPSYEISLQITNPDDKGKAGVYPIYINEKNYVRVTFNYDTQMLDVSGMANGKAMNNNSYSLKNIQSYYADMKYTDNFEKVFSFNSPAWIDAIQLNRVPSHNSKEFFGDMFEKVSADYNNHGKWSPVTGNIKEAANPLYNELSFDKIQSDALRFINREATDHNHNIYKIRVSEIFRQSYNLRAVVLDNELLLIVDGRLIARIPHKFEAAQTGIFSEGCLPTFNGILRYELPL